MPANVVLLIALLIAVVALPVAWRVAARRTAERYERALRRLDADLRSGKAGAGDADPSPGVEAGSRRAAWLPRELFHGGEPSPGIEAVRQRLATGWMPVRGESSEILPRLAQFLQTAVVKPLVRALHARGRGIRLRIQEALDAIEDIEFYAETPELKPAPADLAAVVEGVVREYEKAFKIRVRLDLPGEPLACRADVDAVQDAIYLILANGGRHGGGKPLEVSLRRAGGMARLVVRDAGAGFSGQALARASEPFFSTVPGSLGLGLTHARHVVQAHGGTLETRNGDRGGGEVEAGLPLDKGEAPREGELSPLDEAIGVGTADRGS